MVPRHLHTPDSPLKFLDTLEVDIREKHNLNSWMSEKTTILGILGAIENWRGLVAL